MDLFWHALEAVGNILLQCLKAVSTILRSTEFISALGGALGGAFFGAFLAARFESKRRRDEKRDREYEAFLRTQAVIIAQGNSLGWVAEDYPNADSFNNLRTIVLGFTRQMVDFKDLAFIAKSSNPQLLIELDVASESYDFFQRLLESRNAAIEEILRHPDKDVVIEEFLRAALETDHSDQTPRQTEDEPLGDDIDKIMAKGVQLLLFKLRETNRRVPKSLAHAKSVNEKAMKQLLAFAGKEFPGRQVLSAHEDASSPAPAPRVTGT
jgi:hypothetical protein